MNVFSRTTFIFCLFFLLYSGQSVAATIVQLDIQIGAQPIQAVYLELFDDVDTGAPATAANFLNYVEVKDPADTNFGERRFDNTFIHRLAPNFVLQLGGYTFDPSLGVFGDTDTSTLRIRDDPPVINEFSPARSNVRGTIAMAKAANDENSATSEWFFNLKDNSGNLDNQNGGFTVFGQVLSPGMGTIDAIASLEISDQGGVFNSLPIVNYTNGDPVTTANLVTLTNVTENPAVPLIRDNLDLDFGLVAINIGDTLDVEIQNIGAANLIIGNIDFAGSLSPPFSVSVDSCSGQTILPMANCTITVRLDPTVEGDTQDSFNVPSNAINLPDLVVTLHGTGVPDTPVLDVTPTSVVFPTVFSGDIQNRELTVQNRGGGTLFPGNVSITGTNAAVFSIPPNGNDCINASLAIGETCSIMLELFGDSAGEGPRAASLNLDAQPDNQSVSIPMAGSVITSSTIISVSSPITIADTKIGETQSAVFGIRNAGIDTLIISNKQIIGADAASFSLGNFCTTIPQGSGCGEQITFTPSFAADTFDATVRITSNDPDTPVLDIPVVASAGGDGDGVTATTEDAAPNNGDGNSDGIADSTQAHVTSLPNINGEYVTIEAPVGLTLADIRAVDNPSPADTPTIAGSTSLEFNQGFFTITVEGVVDETTVTLYLPRGRSANQYFKYGKTPDFPIDHWYLFNFDGETGAEYFDGRIVLHFVDGKRGDDDLAANGTIVDPGGPATTPTSISSGGGGGGCTLDPSTQTMVEKPFRMDIILLITGLLLIHLHRKIAVRRHI